MPTILYKLNSIPSYQSSPTKSFFTSRSSSEDHSINAHLGMAPPKPSAGTRSRSLKVKIFARDTFNRVNPVVIHRKLNLARFIKTKERSNVIRAPPPVRHTVDLTAQEIQLVNLSVVRGQIALINNRLTALYQSWADIEKGGVKAYEPDEDDDWVDHNPHLTTVTPAQSYASDLTRLSLQIENELRKLEFYEKKEAAVLKAMGVDSTIEID